MRTTSDELLKKCGAMFVQPEEAREFAKNSPCLDCARKECELSGFFELARRQLFLYAVLERKEHEYDLLNVFAEALPALVIDCKERIAKNECTAK